MQIYLAAAPSQLQAAAKYKRTLAHAAYRIGSESTLLRQKLSGQCRGGLLAVSDRNAPSIQNPESLCAAVMRECTRQHYHGVLLDFEEPPRQDRILFARTLGQTLSSNHKTLYLPESYGEAAQQAVILICTAISGGNLQEHLRDAVARYGKRLALDVQRLQMDFLLPAPTGMGQPSSQEDFRRLREQEPHAVYFSQDLCARYFTYTREGKTHFVLFDDAGTLSQKVKLGIHLGYCAAFFMWPEVQDLAFDLFR